jgi:hypothetical protein
MLWKGAWPTEFSGPKPATLEHVTIRQVRHHRTA